MSDILTAAVSTPSAPADWKYYDNNCSRWQLILLLMLLSEADVQISLSLSFCVRYLVQPLPVISQATRPKQSDFFRTAISINEVTTEWTIQRHLTLKMSDVSNTEHGKQRSHVSPISSATVLCFWSLPACYTGQPDVKSTGAEYTALLCWQLEHTETRGLRIKKHIKYRKICRFWLFSNNHISANQSCPLLIQSHNIVILQWC